MEEVNISETESRYYRDIFLCCDVEKSGKVPILKATEMFRSASLSNEVLRQIMAIAGIPQTALHMSKVQFYSCLKLIAAYQAKISLRQELLSSTIALPLPKFCWKNSPILSADPIDLNGRSGIQWNKTLSSDDFIELVRQSHNNTRNSDIPSTDSEVEQNDVELQDRTRHLKKSPEAWSTASDSPTPTNSIAERQWAQRNVWQGLLCEEQRQLLGTEEESSDRHSSDEDNETDLESCYQITTEQRDYYITQFKVVQPDQNGLLSGQTARVFFEKSRIPVEELRHIWQLCDVTKDGALSLAEFIAAMHLVVLRRNNIPLPSELPSCLMPSIINNAIIGPPEADLLHLGDEKLIMQEIADTITNQSRTTIDSISGQTNKPSSPNILATSQASKTKSQTSTPSTEQISPTKQKETDWINQSKEWTKFAESPTSNVSSPGPKPVNFDMQRTAQAVVSDPQILHPVPLRITPVGIESIEDEANRTLQRKSDMVLIDSNVITLGETEISPKQTNLLNIQHRDSLQTDLMAIQRPQPKKILTKNFGALPPPPQRESIGANESSDFNNSLSMPCKKEPPPLPPPRPHKHARSSSLDLNKFKLNGNLRPEVTLVTKVNQLDIDDNLPTPPNHNIQFLQSSLRSSAFEVYRKPTPRGFYSPDSIPVRAQAEYELRVSAINDCLKQATLSQEKGLSEVLVQLEEQNVLLLRLCNDLSEELIIVQQKKEEIRSKLDVLGAHHSTV